MKLEEIFLQYRKRRKSLKCYPPLFPSLQICWCKSNRRDRSETREGGHCRRKAIFLLAGLFLLFIFFFSSGILFAQSPEEIFIKANLSYEDEKYEEAISLYEELLRMDTESAAVFYNLGNSYFKLKKIGKAIVNYERALRLAPRDSDIKLNLKLARGMAVDKIDEPEKGFILSGALFLYDRMNINELLVTFLVIYLIIITLLIFSIFFVEKRKELFYTVGAVGFFLVIFAIYLVAKVHKENFVKSAIIVSEKVDVRSGPKHDYLLQFSLHEGTKVRIVEELQGWYGIDISKDLRGWLPKDSVEII